MQTMPATSLRLIYLGMQGVLSVIPFQSLIHAGMNIVAAGLPVRSGIAPGSFPAIQPHGFMTLQDAARQADVPLLFLHQPLTTEQISYQDIDVILVSCFPWHLPGKILEFPLYGCFNLHPSLLPAYRGADPITWQLRDKNLSGGVTLHKMTQEIDAGDIALQREVQLDEHQDRSQTESLLATHGAEMMVELVNTLASGELKLTPQ
jgi:methionyl-tRNA formyltransferase